MVFYKGDIMIKAVIFDLDGTLLNTIEDLANSVNYALASQGFSTHSLERIRSFVGNGVEMLIKRALPEEYKEDEAVMEKSLGLFSAHYKVHGDDFTKPYFGILDMLETLTLSGYQLAVLSNKPHEPLLMLCDKHFNGIFEKAYGAREGVLKKPAKAPLLNLISELGLLPEEVIYIGDSEVDILTAQNAQVKVLAVTWGFRDEDYLKTYKPDGLLNYPDELVAYLLSL